VDEVFELLLVLVCVAIGLVAQHPTLLDEVFECGTRVPRGAEPKLASRLRRRQRATPAQKVEQLR